MIVINYKHYKVTMFPIIIGAETKGMVAYIPNKQRLIRTCSTNIKSLKYIGYVM